MTFSSCFRDELEIKLTFICVFAPSYKLTDRKTHSTLIAKWLKMIHSQKMARKVH